LQISVGHEQFQAPLDIADPRQPHGSTAAGQRGRHRHC
jgi:hypothetical protein